MERAGAAGRALSFDQLTIEVAGLRLLVGTRCCYLKTTCLRYLIPFHLILKKKKKLFGHPKLSNNIFQQLKVSIVFFKI